MTVSLITIPCLADNYAFILRDEALGLTALIDAPEAAPIQRVLDAKGWQLDQILLTHHHPDHVMGVDALRDGAAVIGAAADAHRLPDLDRAIAPGDALQIAGHAAQVFDVSGHTIGHLALYVPSAEVIFTGDSLMAMGCGRLFEGDAAMMWRALAPLRDLPGDTRVASGHEYTETNLRFAMDLSPDHPALAHRAQAIRATRAQGLPTVPSLLREECATNPFLRADDPGFATQLGLQGQSPEEIFAYIRAKRDVWS